MMRVVRARPEGRKPSAESYPPPGASGPSSPKRTSPAITAAAARVRDSNSPRSTSSVSSLVLATPRRVSAVCVN